jgi:hypothetical protein
LHKIVNKFFKIKKATQLSCFFVGDEGFEPPTPSV